MDLKLTKEEDDLLFGGTNGVISGHAISPPLLVTSQEDKALFDPPSMRSGAPQIAADQNTPELKTGLIGNLERALPLTDEYRIKQAEDWAIKNKLDWGGAQRDENGNIVYNIGGKAFYENKPGVSAQDMTSLGMNAAVGGALGAGVTAGASKIPALGGTLGKLGTEAVGAATGQSAMSGAAAAVSGEQFNTSEVGMAGLAGAGFMTGMLGMEKMIPLARSYIAAQARNATRAVGNKDSYGAYAGRLSTDDPKAFWQTLTDMSADRSLPPVLRQEVQRIAEGNFDMLPKNMEGSLNLPGFTRSQILSKLSDNLARSGQSKVMQPYVDQLRQMDTEVADLVQNFTAANQAVRQKGLAGSASGALEKYVDQAEAALRKERSDLFEKTLREQLDTKANPALAQSKAEQVLGSMVAPLNPASNAPLAKFVARIGQMGGKNQYAMNQVGDLFEEAYIIGNANGTPIALTDAARSELAALMRAKGGKLETLAAQTPAAIQKDPYGFPLPAGAPTDPAGDALLRGLVTLHNSGDTAADEVILKLFKRGMAEADNPATPSTWFVSDPKEMFKIRARRYAEEMGHAFSLRAKSADLVDAFQPPLGQTASQMDRQAKDASLALKSALEDGVDSEMVRRGVAPDKTLKGVNYLAEISFGNRDELMSSRAFRMANMDDPADNQTLNKVFATKEVAASLSRKMPADVNDNLLAAEIERQLSRASSLPVPAKGAVPGAAQAKAVDIPQGRYEMMAEVAQNASTKGKELLNDYNNYRDLIARKPYGAPVTAGTEPDIGWSFSDLYRGFTKGMRTMSPTLTAKVLTAPIHVKLDAGDQLMFRDLMMERNRDKWYDKAYKFARRIGLSSAELETAQAEDSAPY